jgi:hypothetical protein
VPSRMEGNKQDGKKLVELWNAHKWTKVKRRPPKGTLCWLLKDPANGKLNNK